MCHLNRIKNYLILLLLFIFLFTFNVSAIVHPTSEFYVNDYANILSRETEEYIVSKSSKLEGVDGCQIVVVTVKNLEGYSLENYANKLFREFGIGDKNKNNGLLLLLALEERQFRVEVGYGLEGILPDGKTGRFQDNYIIPYLKNDQFDEGIKNGYDAFYAEIVKQNNLKIDYNEPIKNDDDVDNFSYTIMPIIGLFVGNLIGCILQLFIFRTKSSKRIFYKFNFITLVIYIISFLGIEFIILTFPLTYTKNISFIVFIIFFILGVIASTFKDREHSGSAFWFSSSSGDTFSGGGSSGGGGSSRGF